MKWSNEFLYLVSFQVRRPCLSNGLNFVLQSSAITKLGVPVNDIIFLLKESRNSICSRLSLGHKHWPHLNWPHPGFLDQNYNLLFVSSSTTSAWSVKFDHPIPPPSRVRKSFLKKINVSFLVFQVQLYADIDLLFSRFLKPLTLSDKNFKNVYSISFNILFLSLKRNLVLSELTFHHFKYDFKTMSLKSQKTLQRWVFNQPYACCNLFYQDS